MYSVTWYVNQVAIRASISIKSISHSDSAGVITKQKKRRPVTHQRTDRVLHSPSIFDICRDVSKKKEKKVGHVIKNVVALVDDTEVHTTYQCKLHITVCT